MNKLNRGQVSLVLWLTSALAAACSTGIGQRVPVAAGPIAPTSAGASPASRVDPPTPGGELRTREGKLMCGYQGWFGCPGDGSPLDTWEHWFRRGVPATAATLRVDMWPDVSDLAASET